MTSSRCQPIFGVASANSTNQRDFMRQESLQQRNKSKQFISGKEKFRSCRAGGEFFFLEVMSGPVCQHIEVFTNFWGRPKCIRRPQHRQQCGTAMADESNSEIPPVARLKSGCGWKRDNCGRG